MKVRNAEKLQRKLAAIPKQVRRRVREALEKSAPPIVSQMKGLAPVDDGDLRNSIGYTFGQYRAANANVRGVTVGGGLGDPDLSVVLHAGDEKAFYARWIEFGIANTWEIGGRFKGSKHPGFGAQPFFFPPYRSNRRLVRGRITRAMKAGIKEATAK